MRGWGWGCGGKGSYLETGKLWSRRDNNLLFPLMEASQTKLGEHIFKNLAFGGFFPNCKKLYK